jgi:tRNA modification GTPase
MTRRGREKDFTAGSEGFTPLPPRHTGSVDKAPGGDNPRVPSSLLAALDDPIAAIASAPGRGAVGIVRISGRGLAALARALTGRELAPRQATYTPFLDAARQPLDQGLAIYFPAPHSYTGEDVLELQAHGGPVLLQLLLARCLDAAATTGPARLRPAEPGEFTQRAFLNGKLDLAQAEAVADLIDAGTEAAARSAGRALAGAFSCEVEALAAQLIDLRVLVEATLDFPEEEIDFLEKARARERLATATAALDALLARTRQGALLVEGMSVVIAGQPNAGKSSLLNALAGAELAIVTPVAGTTRDKIGQTIQIEGVPVHVIDTAGLRADKADEAIADEVERIGIALSWREIERADAVIFLHDLTRLADPAYRAADATIRERLATVVAAERVLHVFNKHDAAPAALPPGGLAISARTGAGLAALRAALLDRAGWQALPEGVYSARTRHVQALQRAREHLIEAGARAAERDAALDLLAEELRLAHEALGQVTGRMSADALLGEIFGRFCIGK